MSRQLGLVRIGFSLQSQFLELSYCNASYTRAVWVFVGLCDSLGSREIFAEERHSVNISHLVRLKRIRVDLPRTHIFPKIIDRIWYGAEKNLIQMNGCAFEIAGPPFRYRP